MMTFALAPYGRVFSTRPRGAELLHAVEKHAAGVDRLTIDFAGVEQVSYSFADEFAGVLLQRLEQGNWHGQIVFANVAPKIERVILGSIQRRGLDLHRDAGAPLTFC